MNICVCEINTDPHKTKERTDTDTHIIKNFRIEMAPLDGSDSSEGVNVKLLFLANDT